MKVFLGGTVNGSTWRDEIMPQLKIDYFNPVVDEWTEEARLQEIHEREQCEFNLYVLTPKMLGFYAIAEIADDSYKKPDKTIFCFLHEDDGLTFSREQEKSLEHLGKLATSNGAIWLKSLDEIVRYLNSAADQREASIPETNFKDIFISYGRRHSSAFAGRLFHRLTSLGYKVWFDMNNIPLGVDFQEQIDDGIRKADNIVYIISPHSVNSLYCYKELILALKYNKRIIPILHIEPTGSWDKMHPVISRLNWIYARQTENFDIPLEEWLWIDDFEQSVKGLQGIVESQQDYVRLHTHLLDKALEWDEHFRNNEELLVGNERIDASEWLVRREFFNQDNVEVQPPCTPTDLHAEYITESKKNAENLMTDVFLAYAREDLVVKRKIQLGLNHRGFSVWSDVEDIYSGSEFEKSIEKGIIEADNVVYLISPGAIESEYCIKELELAQKYNKRIFPLLIDQTVENLAPQIISGLQYIDFTDLTDKLEIEVKDQNDVLADVEARKSKSPFELAMSKLIKELLSEQTYYHQHKMLLAQAVRWQNKNYPDSMLLRGYNLENAATWQQRSSDFRYPPTDLQKELISSSQAKAGTLGSEVFVSYSRNDGDFARLLNHELQSAGKTTWFDQESIASATDFQAEINKGIETSDNFLFVISPASVGSPYCADEVSYAQQQGKRIITILHKPTDAKIIPGILAAVQWIDFNEQPFSKAFNALLLTLNSDREYIVMHTQISQRAIEWERAARPNDLLLRGTALSAAKNWLDVAQNKKKEPAPREIQTEYITRSDEYEANLLLKARQQRRIRRLLVVVTIAALITIFFGLFALFQWREAEVQRDLATEQKDLAIRNEQLAKREADSASKARKIAELQKLEAEKQAENARLQAEEANRQRTIAQKAVNVADSLREIAQMREDEAHRQRIRAVYQAEKIEELNNIATMHLYNFNSKDFAGEAYKSSGNTSLQAYLSATSHELKDVALEMANKYNIPLEFEPGILEALQKAAENLKNDNLSTQKARKLIVENNVLITGQEPNILKFYDIEYDNSGFISKLKLRKEIKLNFYGRDDFIYSVATVNDKLFVLNSASILFIINRETDQATPEDLTINGVNLLKKLPFSDELWLASSKGAAEIKFTDGRTKNKFSKADEKYSYLLENVLRINNTDKNLKNQPDISIWEYSSDFNSLFTGDANGKLMRIGTDSTGRVQIQHFPVNHPGSISEICISHNQKWLATASYDGLILLWNLELLHAKESVEMLKPVYLRKNNSKYVLGMSFTSDDKFLLIADNTGIRYTPMRDDLILEFLSDNIKSGDELDKWWNYYKKGDLRQPDIKE